MNAKQGHAGLLGLMAAALLIGCGPSEAERQAAAQRQQELEKLRKENQELQTLKADLKELPRLRRENQELDKLKSVPDEIEKVRKDSDQIRVQIAQAKQAAEDHRKRAIAQAQAAAQSAAAAAPNVPGSQGVTNVFPGQVTADTPLEGDEILIEPRLLSKLLPQFNWNQLERKEPIAVKALLDQQGLVFTNYQQLRALGVTNFVIQRAPPPPPPPPQP